MLCFFDSGSKITLMSLHLTTAFIPFYILFHFTLNFNFAFSNTLWLFPFFNSVDIALCFTSSFLFKVLEWPCYWKAWCKLNCLALQTANHHGRAIRLFCSIFTLACAMCEGVASGTWCPLQRERLWTLHLAWTYKRTGTVSHDGGMMVKFDVLSKGTGETVILDGGSGGLADTEASQGSRVIQWLV